MSLFFRFLAALTVVLLLYDRFVLCPQIREVKRKMDLPEFQGTAHQKTIQFSLSDLKQRVRRLRIVIFLLGAVLLLLSIRIFK